MLKLNKEEKQILKMFESGQMSPIENMSSEIKKHKKYAANFMKKDRQINIRISQFDLDGIKKKSLAIGIPYQTLITSVLHRYVTGKITAKF